ncbi:hypothetical protein HER10_EVM0013142 [Colletotrichum scovillei]|uniref:uncharacterized protein n=1 Tax=Colletotrichum scovillei TaxID=1209932 RepID=UPI0015C3D779|nr:uncharacterized protein HER10_EVM0013142 [Colletotrichum scovillei]KAF4782512.1 hypothetical protein HER10_EVM0013142 [Colletotrichum scovillei]
MPTATQRATCFMICLDNPSSFNIWFGSRLFVTMAFNFDRFRKKVSTQDSFHVDAGGSSSRPSLEPAGSSSFLSNASNRSKSPDDRPSGSRIHPGSLSKDPSFTTSIRDMVIGDKKPKGNAPASSCKTCSVLGFEEFCQSNTIPTANSWVLDLEDVIKNYRKKKCNFCSLLFEAICAHDPFEHPAIKEHMPQAFIGWSFGEWAESLDWKHKIPWSSQPFGRGRDVIHLELDAKDSQVGDKMGWTTHDPNTVQKDLAFATEVAIANTAVHHAIEQSSKSGDPDTARIFEAVRGVLPAVVTLVNRADNKLPVGISVQTTDAQDGSGVGLFVIGVWGFGCGPKPPLSCLVTFNLRVAASYPVQAAKCSLRYGNIIGSRINVEDDCRSWMIHCLENHLDDCDKPAWACNLPAPAGEHFRLVDVKNERVVRFEKPPRYAALSYVWGKEGKTALNLHVTNLADLSTSINNRDRTVAKTTRDALEATKRLGIDYLWVDSLCIIQKDKNGRDDEPARLSQIHQMDRIFGHAQIVLVAAGGSHADVGLAGVSQSRISGQIASEVIPGVNVLLPVQYPPTYGRWDTRAWTLQEKLLSKRMLVFTENHVSFHCKFGVLREDLPAIQAGNIPPPIAPLAPPKTRQDVLTATKWDGTPVILRSPHFTQYVRILEQYTSRGITDSADVLNGVTGLLNVLGATSNPRGRDINGESLCIPGSTTVRQKESTLYGLPERLLDLALLWQPPASEQVHLVRRHLGKTDRGAFPSWSWAGWEAHPTTSNGYATETHPGVRFEEPFWVSSYNDLCLRKIMAFGPEAEERYRPLITWYKIQEESIQEADSHTKTKRRPVASNKPDHLRSSNVRTQLSNRSSEVDVRSKLSLMPVNSNGLGIVLDVPDVAKGLLDQALKLPTTQTSSAPVGHRGAALPQIPQHLLKAHCLVCVSQVAQFTMHAIDKARTEILWKQKQRPNSRFEIPKENQDMSTGAQDPELEIAKELLITEAEIRGKDDEVAGFVIPTNSKQSIHLKAFDFVLLSESQYWGNEKRVDVNGFPLYNVMMVEWDHGGKTATRVGLGKIQKNAWMAANPALRTVILV